MISQTWKAVTPVTTIVDAAAPGLWVCVLEFVDGAFKLKITATGKWKWAPDRECSADGEPGERAPGDVLFASAPLGALIGKIGGSTCDKSDWLAGGAAMTVAGLNRPAVFAVGSSGVVMGGSSTSGDAALRGPLYLAINDSPLRRRYHSGQLTISVFEM